MTVRTGYQWVASPLWEGRRWELRHGGVPVGRVVKFFGGKIQVSRYFPYAQLEGDWSSVGAAAEALLAAVGKDRIPRKRRKA